MLHVVIIVIIEDTIFLLFFLSCFYSNLNLIRTFNNMYVITLECQMMFHHVWYKSFEHVCHYSKRAKPCLVQELQVQYYCMHMCSFALENWKSLRKDYLSISTLRVLETINTNMLIHSIVHSVLSTSHIQRRF